MRILIIRYALSDWSGREKAQAVELITMKLMN